MMQRKKQSRCHETVESSTADKPTQRAGGKEVAASPVPASSGGKPAGNSTTKTRLSCGRSNSLSSRGSDSAWSSNKAAGTLKRGSLSHQGCASHQGTRQASRPARPALRLCSSQSFSSLHTSSFTAAPFMRSSRSLSRLDQRATRDDSVLSLQVKKGQTTEKKALSSGQLVSSEDHIRDNKDQCGGDNAEKIRTNRSSEPAESSSSLVSKAESHHHCNKVKKQTRDGVYTLCAMTSGMRHNWVQAVLKNVKPSLTPDATSSPSEQTTHQKSQQPDSQSTEGLENAEQPNSSLQELKSSQCAEETHQKQTEEGLKKQPPSDSSAPSPISPSQQAEGEGVTEASSCAEEAGSDSSTPTTMLSNNECFNEHSNMQRENRQQVEDTCQSDEPRASVNTSCECTNVRAKLNCEQQTGQLVKELEQTQKELSRLQQLNRNLQDELRKERESHSVRRSGLLSRSSSEQALALQQLQKVNNDLRSELEAQKRSQEEAREAELRRRVDLLAQQAQLLVTGDATTLAQAKLEQERRQIHELKVEWERSVTSLKSQLSVSEEQRKEAESSVTQLQQELQSFHSLQQEADRLQSRLHEATAQLEANEEAQAQKEARLQKHLTLLQASQDRERKSLATSLTQAEQHAQDLQERLERAELQVGSLNKTQMWTREIEKAQQQLQEELACTVAAVQKLQEEREQLNCRCQELQNQLYEADGEVSRLQSRLKTDETHYYNLEHSYEKVCEELQVASGKVQQKECETQDIREGYERLLDRKEQELSEVLLKMEVLGNSLEETEVKLSEVLKVCTCASSQLQDESCRPAQKRDSQQQTDLLLTANNSSPKAASMGQLFNNSDAFEHARTHSFTFDSSYQSLVTLEDDPEKFMSVIHMLEGKLYATEEKLRDIMQRLEEHQSHLTCQDPQLCSQLTRSRATAQHLSLLLHSQAKQSQRFAQETENRCRMLVGRFQVALNIIQACRERLQATQISVSDFEKQLATVIACLQQGEKDAERLQHESRNVSKGGDKILNDEMIAGAESNVRAKIDLAKSFPTEDDVDSVNKCLMREIFVVEKMVSVLQSQHGIGQLSLVQGEDEGHQYKSITSQRLALKTEKRTHSGTAECDNNVPLDKAIGRVCAEAELIYAALKFQQQCENRIQVKNQEVEQQRNDLADINPPELAPYEEQVPLEDRGAKSVEEKESDIKMEQPEWLERLISRLERKAKCLRQLCQEISDSSGEECSMEECWENASAVDLNWMQEQAKLMYLTQRLLLDLEQKLQQSEVLQHKLQALCKEQDVTLKDEQEAFNQTLCQLQEDNSLLREELEHAEQKIISVETGNQRLQEDIRKTKDCHEEHVKRLETEFQEKIRGLQNIHEEEMKHLHGFCTKVKQNKTCTEVPALTDSASSLSDQPVMERNTEEELHTRMTSGDAAAMMEACHKDQKKQEISCDESIIAMEEMHRKHIDDLQQQHQKEVAALLKEKDQLLQEETAATMAAIVAMRRAHKRELERSRQSQHIKENADITQLHVEHEKEIQLLHKELGALSAQHTQKCLENSQLNQELQKERQSLMQCQKEKQDLQKKQLHFSLNGTQPHVVPVVNDFYEMEVILRAREAEMQFLRQEARSLREELKIARMDKIYAQNKLKALYTSSQDEPRHDVDKDCEDFKFATWSPSRDTSGQNLEETVTNTSNAAFLKKTEKSSLTHQIRGVRSKSLKEGLSIQERMKLFESF